MKRRHERSSLGAEPACANLVERNDTPGGVTLVNPAKIAKREQNDIVQLAMEVQNADDFLYATACSKLQVIAQQVRFLHNQAKYVLIESKQNTELHRYACNFIKVPGKVYHVYKRPSGQKYFSMLAPDEWRHPHEFVGSFRLEHDKSWTAAKSINHKDKEFTLIHRLINSPENPHFAYAVHHHTPPMEMEL